MNEFHFVFIPLIKSTDVVVSAIQNDKKKHSPLNCRQRATHPPHYSVDYKSFTYWSWLHSAQYSPRTDTRGFAALLSASTNHFESSCQVLKRHFSPTTSSKWNRSHIARRVWNNKQFLSAIRDSEWWGMSRWPIYSNDNKSQVSHSQFRILPEALRKSAVHVHAHMPQIF